MKKRMKVELSICRLSHSDGLPLPDYQTAGSAGMDLHAAIPDSEPIFLRPGQRKLVPTGLSVALPDSFEAQIRPRSGLAVKHGITCLNSPGTIDSDYRGEVQVLLINLGEETFTIQRGDRIAQMVIAPVGRAVWVEMHTLSDTDRGSGGFGSTGGSQHSTPVLDHPARRRA